MDMQFRAGDRVEVISDKYNGRTAGLTGSVRCANASYIAVVIDGETNTRSEYGCFYYKHNQLKQLEGGTIMEGNYRIAKVQFIEGHSLELKYNYACYDDSIVEGDICVVKSANHGFGLARVVDFAPKTGEAITREIVCKADFTAYDERVRQRKRIAELMSEMKKRTVDMSELLLYRQFAAFDPTMAELLKEYETLTGGATDDKCKDL